MINLRPATVCDIGAILHVHYAAVHGPATSTFYTQDTLQAWLPSPTDEDRLNRLHEAMEDSGELIVVAVSSENDMIVGFGSVVPLQEEIRAVYVDPAFARQGVGTKILARLEELAVDHDAHKLYIDASLNAERFYCHHGYSVVERTTHRFRSGIEIDCVKMSKELRRHSQ